MKMKGLLLGILFGCSTISFASNTAQNTNIIKHAHANQHENTNLSAEVKNESFFDCKIDINNTAYSRLRVYATFDDGASLNFDVYPREVHSIDLYYYGYCHSGMYIAIDRLEGGFWYRIFDNYVPVNHNVIVQDYAAVNIKQINNK